MLTLEAFETELLGMTLKCCRTEPVANRASVESLRFRMRRNHENKDSTYFVFEEKVPAEPYFGRDGVQKGWTPNPPVYRLYSVVSKNIEDMVKLAIAAGFRPEAWTETQEELYFEISDLLENIESRKFLHVVEASSNFVMMEVSEKSAITNSDARKILDFNASRFNVSFGEISSAIYLKQFITEQFLILGDTF